jgi:predicted NBD/HSP70 family sugar kinase
MIVYTVKYMFLAIDVGGTKTLTALFTENGDIVAKNKIPTDKEYAKFLNDLKELIDTNYKEHTIQYCCCAVPGTIDLEHGIALALGNEIWRDVPISSDISNLLPGTPVLIHNDAKLAGLSEAALVGGEYKKVLYLTISTGIGGGVISNGKIDADFENFEPGQMVFETDGQNQQWEHFASGRALKAHYGKQASEIDDPEIWREYAKVLTAGFENLLATVRPDVVIVGGGVGAHFEKFQPYLEENLNSINNPLVPTVPILKAKRPEEAVIYGCYEFIKQHL